MKRLLTALVLLTASASSIVAQASQPSTTDRRARSDDLAQLVEWANLEQSFSAARRAQALEIISGHRTAGTAFSDAEFYMEIRRIVALADNGHSNVSDRPVHEAFGLVPIRVYWFSDGLRVVRARSAQREFLGSRIDGIEGLPLAEMENRLREFHGGTRAFFRRYSAQALMLSPALLHAVGLSRSPRELRLSLVTEDDERQEVTLAVDFSSSSVHARPWRQLVPTPIAGEDDWVTVLDPSSKLPLYLLDEEARFRSVPLKDGALIYIQLRSNVGSDDEPIDEFTSQVQESLREGFPHSIILDNRQNGGGDLSETAKFALGLSSLTYSGGRVYVITGSGTFSAGIYTSFYPKAADAERTLIVGEPVGDRARFWAETGAPFRLGDSGYHIGYALQLHDVAAGCPDPKICHMMGYPEAWNMAVGSLDPDWPVATRFADYAAGSDPVLERILEAVAEEIP